MSEPQSKEGLAARARALRLVQSVLHQGQQLDDALVTRGEDATLESRDAALAHAIAAAVLRHYGQLSQIVTSLLSKPLPRSSGPAHDILLLGLAQLLVLRSNAPAAINLSVELAKQDKQAQHFSGLVNGVLREAHRQQPDLGDARLNLPGWLASRLVSAYGHKPTAAIAAAHLQEAPIDLSVKQGVAHPDGTVLPTGTIRLAGDAGSLTGLAGFAEGNWWVQDAAAALPIRLLDTDLAGKSALDLCAAPGGKTAQLASLGARVTAVDISKSRMQRLQQNMQRLNFDVECRIADIRKLADETLYDIVVLDAPCSATGTMRRHPDLGHLKSAAQIDKLASIQRELLQLAAQRVKPGGSLLYCVCSLLYEEGDVQARDFLASRPDFTLRPAEAVQLGGQVQFLDGEGFLRTLPSMMIGDSQGLDGFFAAHFVRR